MNYKIFKGKNLEEVKNKALKELNLDEQDVVIQKKIIKKGILKNEEYEINVIPLDDIKKFLLNYINDVINKMEIKIKIDCKIENSRIYVNLSSDNNAILIGKNGKNLDAFQLICKRVIQTKFNCLIDVVLDVEFYKKKQLDKLKKDVIKIAKEVEKTNTLFELDNMNSYERRLVHETLKSFTNIKTESVGQEPNRHIVIKPIK